jgi:hypothetical protein
MDWFRSWHGAPTDPKWLLIAKRSETQAGVVSAIVWALFDFASQNSDDRGSVESFDTETYAAFSGFDEVTVKRVIECLKDKNIIVDGYLAAWERRQTKRDDNSTPRVQKHRNAKKRNVTQETPREDKIREEKIDSEANASGADAPPDPAIPEREYFLRGREVLGKGNGALIAKLLKAKGGNVALARAALEQASQKQNPTEYVAAICRGPPVSTKPLTAHQQKQAEAKGILDEIGSAIRGGSGQDDTRLLRHDPSGRPESVRGRAGGNLIELSPGGYRAGG